MKPPVLDMPAAAPATRAAIDAVAPHGAGAASAPVEHAASPSLAPRFWTVVASHIVTDIYPVLWATLVLVFRRDLHLTDFQVGTVYAASAVLSGLPQGLFAWASDKYDTRLFGALGLFFSATCMSSIGFAQNFWQLLALICIGQTGNGIYHPISAAIAGQVGGRVLRGGRAPAVSIFFAAGVLGGIIGPISAATINARAGHAHIAWLMVPGILMAVCLHFAIAKLRHRHDNHHEILAAISSEESRERWRTVWILFTGNCLRFTVNTAMFVMFPVWASAVLPGVENTDKATSLNSTLIIAMQIGMGIFAIAAARLIPQGKERGAIFTMSIIGAVFTGLVGFAGTYIGLWAMYVCGALSGLGFAAILPITIALAQRLLPGRTGLASSLMMGVSWSAAAFAPAFAMLFFGGVGLEKASLLPAWRIDLAFVGFGAMLVVAGALALRMPASLLKRVAAHR